MNRVRLVVSLVVVMVLVGAAHASVRIGGWAFSANGELARDFQYTGPCPVDLKFDWGVISTDQTTATYTFTRSDGGHSSSSQSVALPAGHSVPVLDTWRLGANTAQFATYSGWVQLNISAPNPVSQKISFTIHCTPPSVRIGGSAFFANGQLARNYQYSGACPVDLKFDWGVIATADTTATYSFTRNDGGHSSSSQSVDLPAGHSVPVLNTWRLGANTPAFASYSGWVQLNVDSPNAVSNKIAFTIHCQ